MAHKDVHQLLESLRRTMQFEHTNHLEFAVGSLLPVIVMCNLKKCLIAVLVIDDILLGIKLQCTAKCRAACFVFCERHRVVVFPHIQFDTSALIDVLTTLFEGRTVYFWLFYDSSWPPCLQLFLLSLHGHLVFVHPLLVGFVVFGLPVFFKQILALKANVTGLAFEFSNEV